MTSAHAGNAGVSRHRVGQGRGLGAAETSAPARTPARTPVAKRPAAKRRRAEMSSALSVTLQASRRPASGVAGAFGGLCLAQGLGGLPRQRSLSRPPRLPRRRRGGRRQARRVGQAKRAGTVQAARVADFTRTRHLPEACARPCLAALPRTWSRSSASSLFSACDIWNRRRLSVMRRARAVCRLPCVPPSARAERAWQNAEDTFLFCRGAS